MLALSYKSTKTRFVFFRRGKKDGSSPEIRLRRFASKAKIYNRLDMFFSISFLVLLLILALSNVQTWFFVGLTLNFDRFKNYKDVEKYSRKLANLISRPNIYRRSSRRAFKDKRSSILKRALHNGTRCGNNFS